MTKNSAADYKRRNMEVWNEVAPRYHKRWASTGTGPFQSTEKLVGLLDIKEGDRVLDIACGTGAVTKKISWRVGKSGLVVGADTSITAINIAKRWNIGRQNVHFINADAERLRFADKFDTVTCQYALFFFPNAPKALRNMRNNLKKSGSLGIAVHGHRVPFYINILEAVKEFIPDYVPPGTPQLDRYGSKAALRSVVRDAGFSRISVNSYIFRYSPGTFEQYWRNYRRYVAKPLKEKLDSLSRKQARRLKERIADATEPYTKNGTVEFPWQSLILTAKK